MSMKRGHLINKINRLMPNAKATTEAEFYGDESINDRYMVARYSF